MRGFLKSARVELRALLRLRALPPRVAAFHLRARIHARRTGDEFSLLSASPPAKLAILLELAKGRRSVAELGTATGWTSIALALADVQRDVFTFDPVDRPQRRGYLALVSAQVRDRISFVEAPGADAPRAVELLYIDSNHDRESTVEEVNAWAPLMSPGAIVVFDDYGHPEYPGVREAVAQLGLAGAERDSLYVWQIPPAGYAAVT